METIEVSILSGELVFEEQRKVGLPSLQPSAVPPSSRPAHSPREEIVPTSFEVRWVDEIGEPIEGLDVAFSVSGRRETKKTGGDGVARFTDPNGSSFAFAEASSADAVRQVVKERWDTIREGKLLTETDATIFQLPDGLVVGLQAHETRLVSVQPFVARRRLIGAFFDTSKSFLVPEGLAAARAIVSDLDANSNLKLLIVGHTDLTGAADYNDLLSLERAQALKDYLTDNVDGWLQFYADAAFEKRWGSKEDLAMIGALPDVSSRSPGEPLVHWFQRTRGLTSDGIAGPQTRRRLITEYMAIEGTSLPTGVDAIVHGCGENFPQEPTPHATSDRDDRRVEVFLFDGVLGVQPPPPGPNSSPGWPEYPEWVRRSKRTDDHVLPALGQFISAPAIHSEASGGGGLALGRTRLGVGEEVSLTNEVAPATWTVSGGGTFVLTSGNTAIFRAGERADTAVITATGRRSVATLTFEIVEPTGVTLQISSKIAHKRGRPTNGFLARPFLEPIDVSFENIEVRELNSSALATGFYATMKGQPHQPRGQTAFSRSARPAAQDSGPKSKSKTSSSLETQVQGRRARLEEPSHLFSSACFCSPYNMNFASEVERPKRSRHKASRYTR